MDNFCRGICVSPLEGAHTGAPLDFSFLFERNSVKNAPSSLTLPGGLVFFPRTPASKKLPLLDGCDFAGPGLGAGALAKPGRAGAATAPAYLLKKPSRLHEPI